MAVNPFAPTPEPEAPPEPAAVENPFAPKPPSAEVDEDGLAAPIVTTPEDLTRFDPEAEAEAWASYASEGTVSLSDPLPVDADIVDAEAETQAILDDPETMAAIEEAQAEEPKRRRRRRGELEIDVLDVLRKAKTGHLGFEVGLLTPHRVAKAVEKVTGLPASTGRVASLFDDWAAAGICTLSEKPVRFEDFTYEAKTEGIKTLKERHKAEVKASTV